MTGPGSGMNVVSDAMRHYAQQAQQAGNQIKQINLAPKFDKVKTAMPGSTAGDAASSCPLIKKVSEWGEEIAKQGHAVGAADASYIVTDEGAHNSFQGLSANGSAEAH